MVKSEPLLLARNVSTARHEAYLKHAEDMDVACGIMLASMFPELQKQHEHLDAPTILLHLQELFEEQNRTERYEISKALFRCRMVEGTSDMQHGLKMNGYIEAVDKQSSKSVIVVSSSTSYKSYKKKVNQNKAISTQGGVSKKGS